MNQHKVYRAIRKKTQSRKVAIVATETWGAFEAVGIGAFLGAVVIWLLTR